jgi:hypothetical protein
MNKITDDDLTLLFYGEHDDPQLATKVAESAELSERFNSLSAELKLADTYRPPHRGSDYGADVWQRISPRLDGVKEPMRARISSWLQAMARPRFSLAGALSVALITVVAFMWGRDDGQDVPGQSPIPVDATAQAMVAIDSNHLLTHSVSGHLEQVNLVLTQFVNSTESSGSEAAYATDMLVANRLYRQAASAQGKHQLAAFLEELEPLLIELAYEAQSGSQATRERMQKEVRDSLLFRVRVMNNQLNKSQISA